MAGAYATRENQDARVASSTIYARRLLAANDPSRCLCLAISLSGFLCHQNRVGIELQRAGAKGSSKRREAGLAQPAENLVESVTASLGRVQKKRDRKGRSPRRRGPIATHEYIAQDQSPLGVEATMELTKQRTVFIDPVSVQ